jgi:hypothetical protein
MAILINGVIKRGVIVVDAVLFNGDKVGVPVIGNAIAIEWWDVIMIGRIRVGIITVVRVVALPPHHAIRCPVRQRPYLILGLIKWMGAIHRLVGVVEPGVPGID